MCDIKNQFEKVAAQDSRNMAWLGNAIGWQGLEDEANHNTKNPGRAMTKATEYAATWYLGSLLGGLGDAGGAAGDAANAAATAGDESAGLAMASPYLAQTAGQGIAGSASGMTAQQLAQQALADSTDTGLLGTGAQQSTAQVGKLLAEQAAQQAPQATNQGLLNSVQNGYNSLKGAAGSAYDKAASMAYRGLVPGAGSQQADMLASQTGDFGSYGLAKTMEAANSAQGLSPVQQFATKGLANYLGANGSSKVGNMAMQMGAQNLLKQPERPQPMQGRPAPGGQMEALPQIYGIGQQSPNALGTSNMTEAQKKYLRSLGYNV